MTYDYLDMGGEFFISHRVGVKLWRQPTSLKGGRAGKIPTPMLKLPS